MHRLSAFSAVPLSVCTLKDAGKPIDDAAARTGIVPRVPEMPKYNMRLPEDLRAQAQAEADRYGLDLAEYIRQAILLRIAWDTAIRASDDLDYEALLRGLRHLR